MKGKEETVGVRVIIKTLSPKMVCTRLNESRAAVRNRLGLGDSILFYEAMTTRARPTASIPPHPWVYRIFGDQFAQ
jgi:hypothetical protein